MKQIVIIGASGHGKVVADIAKRNGYEEILFLDDAEGRSCCGAYPVVGKCCDITRYTGDFVVAIGNADIRQKLTNRLEQLGRNLVTLVHPNAVIGEHVEIGKGTVIMAGAVVNPFAHIGNGCIINTCASVDHDCIIRDFAHISVGAHVAGTCEIGERTWIGAGATVSNNISICSDCMIGAGAVVIRNIEKSGTYIGIPAEDKYMDNMQKKSGGVTYLPKLDE